MKITARELLVFGLIVLIVLLGGLLFLGFWSGLGNDGLRDDGAGPDGRFWLAVGLPGSPEPAGLGDWRDRLVNYRRQ